MCSRLVTLGRKEGYDGEREEANRWVIYRKGTREMLGKTVT